MTWNLWWQFGPWEQRQPAIAAEIAAVSADVVCIQEVWADASGDQAQILADNLGYSVVRTTEADGSPQGFGNAILSRRPISPAGQISLPGANGQPSPRTALAVWIDPVEEADGPRQLVVTTHLEWRYDASAVRQIQLQRIVEWIQELAPIGTDEPPVVMAGDLNGQPESSEIRQLTGLEPPYSPGLVFTDTWAATNDDRGHTWTRDNPHAKNAAWPRRRIDFVMVSWPRSKPFGNPLSSRLAGVDPVGPEPATVGSDHYAVVVELDDRHTFDNG